MTIPAFLGLNDLEHRQKINTDNDDEPTRSF
jgi:hypothetical protein